VDLVQPVSRFEPTKARERDGTEIEIPTYPQHLLCDERGLYPAEMDAWEKAVVKTEMERDGFTFWYRNPDRPSQDSLGIAFIDDTDTKIVRPDFIFFAEAEGQVVVDIIDPHGFHLADAIPKLNGLAHYAEAHPGVFRRIEAIAQVGNNLRVLDLTRADVRESINQATSARSLYSSAMAGDYR